MHTTVIGGSLRRCVSKRANFCSCRPSRASIIKAARAKSPSPAPCSSAKMGINSTGRLSTEKKSMSSKDFSTVLVPEPESPVRTTRCRASCLVGGRFTGARALTLHSALMRAGNSHIFAVFRDRTARNMDARVIQFLRDLLIRQRLRPVFFFDHFFDYALQGQQRHCAALRPVH